MRTNEDEKVVAIAKILSSDDQETESGDEAESESEINNIEE